jgi:hypothetical protein
MILPVCLFNDNLQNLASTDGIAQSEMLNAAGDAVASLESQPGKQGALAAFQNLFARYEVLNAEAATHGQAVLAEHTEDAKDRPAAHLNIYRSFEIHGGGAPLVVTVSER